MGYFCWDMVVQSEAMQSLLFCAECTHDSRIDFLQRDIPPELTGYTSVKRAYPKQNPSKSPVSWHGLAALGMVRVVDEVKLVSLEMPSFSALKVAGGVCVCYIRTQDQACLFQGTT